MNKSFKNIGYAILVSFLAALLTGCETKCQDYFNSFSRNGTPIEVYIDPGVRVDHGEIGIGIGLWSTVGVEFRTTVVKPNGLEPSRVNIFRLDEALWSRYVGLTGTAATDSTISATIELRDDAGWWVVAHEIGHALGLDHVPLDGKCHVMSPGYCEKTYDLTDVDLAEFARSESCNPATTVQ